MARKKRNKDRTDNTPTEPLGDENPDLPADEQAGDLQGLTDVAGADSQSVRELAAEGQFFEAAVVSGIEDAPPADVAEVTTKQVPEDDVPREYVDRDLDEPTE
jgi:hypothetical protein